MKVIVAGSRKINEYFTVIDSIYESGFEISEIVSGGAKGPDSIAILYAASNHIPYRVFEANWALWGKMAGPMRNTEMAKYADALIAVWDGKSKGTKNMIKQAEENNLLIYIKRV
jgi:hypothetical protein